MERLTKRFDGWVMRKDCHGPCRTCNGAECADIYPMIDRLAAYEDAMSLERAQELAQAEKDGRLVVLPVENKELTDAEVAEMTGYKCPICVHHSLCAMPGMRPLCGEHYDHFASEAEAALKKREDDICTATGGPCCQCQPGPCGSRKLGEEADNEAD